MSPGLCSFALFSGRFSIVPPCIPGFIAAQAIGQGTVIRILIFEVFPNQHRASGQALGSSTHLILAALLTTIFPTLATLFLPGCVFLFFCGMMVPHLIWVMFMVPEMKGAAGRHSEATGNHAMNGRHQIVGLGEVLWDIFPAGPRFGGAPASFVCSAAGVGGNTVNASMVSAIGRDSPEEKGLEEFRKRSVDVTHVAQLDLQTGSVLVQLDAQGQASYKFMEDTAGDNVPWSTGIQSLTEKADAVCFGTPGQSCDVSRDTIRQFFRSTPRGCLQILDINLRPPYRTRKVHLESLLLANVLKLNSDELPIVSSLLSIQGSEEELLRQLLRMFSFRLDALTREAIGSLLLSMSGERSELPGQEIRVVDTVGARDAFTAALTVGLFRNKPLAEVHSWADRKTAFLCTQAGATPDFPDDSRC